ncbi:hypothetical protein F5887DRAFT_915092 [Amanita rubescens]|nr:hypothetical protein F5887DRAFT_915092 [Amanita rubescens]
MSADIEKGLVPQALIHDEPASTSRESLVHGNSNPPVSTQGRDFSLRASIEWRKITQPALRRFATEASEISTISSGVAKTVGRSKSVVHESTAWHGDERVKLVQKGYRSLAIICTFIAGVQAQILAMTFTSTGPASQIVHAFFFAGLLSNIGAATLSAASARWFEMMTPEEAKHVYDWLNNVNSSDENEEQDTAEEEKRHAGKGDLAPSSAATSTSLQCFYIVEICLCVALRAAPFVAVLGLVFLVAGVMLWVWTHEPPVVRVLCTAMCALLAILLPPFAISHDRIRTLTFFKLRRFSG